MSVLDEFKQRANAAEEQIKILKERLHLLESQLDDTESKSNLILGAPSSMADDFQLNLRYLCERGCKVQPHSEIVTRIANGKYHRMTYLEAQKTATKIAIALSQKLNIGIGDRIGTFMWNNGRHMCLYYGVPSMGAVLHTLNIRLSNAELSYIINHAQDRVIFVDATLLPKFEQIDSNTLSSLDCIVICGANEAQWQGKSDKLAALTTVIDFDELISVDDEKCPPFKWPNLDEKSGAALCYTSGTTGNPKGVMYSHRSCYLQTLMCMGTDIMNISGSDCVLPVVPMFHALSWVTPFSAFCLGYKYVLYNCFRAPTDFLDMVCDERVTLLLGVPTILNGIKASMQNPDIFNKYASAIKASWSRAVCGGSAPSPSVIKWFWDELDIEVIHGWGMTETNPIGSIARRVSRRCDLLKTDEEKYENQIPQGLVVPMVDIKIVKPDNYAQELENDGEAMGELLIRGPMVVRQYYKIDAKHKFYNGWLLTGDIASIQSDYLLCLRDRSKDLIKSGGEWISSVAVENELIGMGNIGKVAVVGVPHQKYQERPIAIIELIDDNKTPPSLQEVRDFLMESGKFSKFQLPDDVLFDKIALTGTGKMSKKLCREKLKKENYVLPQL